MENEKRPLSQVAKKKLTEITRKQNIAEAEKREPAQATPELSEDEIKAKKAKAAEVRKRLRKVSKVEDEQLRELPYFVLRPMKKIPFEEDHYLKDKIKEELSRQAKEKIKKKGDYKRETLKFGHVNSCPREVYFDFFEPWEARPATAKGVMFMDDGTIYHKYIQRMLEDLGVVRESEGYLTLPGLPANGFYDGLIPVATEGKWTICDILEIKRVMPTACDKPRQRDYDQGQLYLFGADNSEKLKLLRIKIRALRLFYSDRSLMSEDGYYGFISMRDRQRMKLIMQYMTFLWEEVVRKKRLVVPPYARDSSKCNTFCMFTERCWRAHAEKVEPRDLDDIEMPDTELVMSAAQEAYRLLTEIGERQAKYKKIKPMIEAYMLHKEIPFLKVEEDEKEERGLKATQGKSLFWHDKKKLIERMGIDSYLDLSDVNIKSVNDLVREHHLDMAIFEKHKRYKIMTMTIKKATRKKKEEAFKDYDTEENRDRH